MKKTTNGFYPGQKITIRSRAICGEKIGKALETYKAIVIGEFKHFYLIEVVFENGNSFKTSVNKQDVLCGDCKVIKGW